MRISENSLISWSLKLLHKEIKILKATQKALKIVLTVKNNFKSLL